MTTHFTYVTIKRAYATLRAQLNIPRVLVVLGFLALQFFLDFPT